MVLVGRRRLVRDPPQAALPTRRVRQVHRSSYYFRSVVTVLDDREDRI